MMSDDKEQSLANRRPHPVLVGLFVGSLLVANVAATKITVLFSFEVAAGVIVFPITYILGDVITEVYGFRSARGVILAGFLANALLAGVLIFVEALPAASAWQYQREYETILGSTPRIVLASLSAYLVGEVANSFAMARLKTLTHGKLLWMRTISSTLFGQGLDTVIFVVGAFVGTLPGDVLMRIVATQWVLKCLYEIACTPITYRLVNSLKRREGFEAFDHDLRARDLVTFPTS